MLKCSLAAHMVIFVVPILAQECHVYASHGTVYKLLWLYNGVIIIWSHLRYLTSRILQEASLSVIEVMSIDHAYFGVSYPCY